MARQAPPAQSAASWVRNGPEDGRRGPKTRRIANRMTAFRWGSRPSVMVFSVTLRPTRRRSVDAVRDGVPTVSELTNPCGMDVEVAPSRDGTTNERESREYETWSRIWNVTKTAARHQHRPFSSRSIISRTARRPFRRLRSCRTSSRPSSDCRARHRSPPTSRTASKSITLSSTTRPRRA